MTDNPNYSYISTVRTPDGGTHYVKDAEARTKITELEAAVRDGTRFLGVTTTELVDGGTGRNVVIEGASVAASAGDFVVRNKAVNGVTTGIEFIWTGTKWSELGSTGTLKALAFRDSASGSFTPTGTVGAPTLNVQRTKYAAKFLAATVDAANETLTLGETAKDVMVGVSISASAPTFTGAAGTVTVS